LNALRKYDIPDVIIGNWKGQYGLEPTPFGDEHSYIEHTLLWAKEAWRVLRSDGVFFLNLADSYSTVSGDMSQDKYGKLGTSLENNIGIIKQPKIMNYPSKCKLMIPERIAIALVDSGWTLRNSIVWYKPNAMPESVTDRFSKKYESIFMFTKQEKYYFDLDSIRVQWDEASIARLYRGNSGDNKYGGEVYGGNQPSNTMSTRRPNRTKEYKTQDPERKINIKGKNPGDVWTVNTQPSTEKHFAMWPEKLVERMIRCSTKTDGAVLDPFAGSGTTLMVTEQLNRIGYGIDLGYQDIQSRRLNEIQKELAFEPAS